MQVNAMLPTRYSPEMAKISAIYTARTASVAKQLFPDVKMVMDYDQLLNKRPNKKKAVFPWHQDMAYWPMTPDTRTVTFSLAVDPTTGSSCFNIFPCRVLFCF
jgi:phytanoyl-CoA hydroxylase